METKAIHVPWLKLGCCVCLVVKVESASTFCYLLGFDLHRIACEKQIFQIGPCRTLLEERTSRQLEEAQGSVKSVKHT